MATTGGSGDEAGDFLFTGWRTLGWWRCGYCVQANDALLWIAHVHVHVVFCMVPYVQLVCLPCTCISIN